MQVFTCGFHQWQQLWKAEVSNLIHKGIHIDLKGPANVKKGLAALKEVRDFKSSLNIYNDKFKQ